ncbi:cell division protein FtsL [Acetivibrio saccincola]|jgi:cell division protein FtsB|uniref:Cell division protein FtsL n=1 Tax=Acetivibrio saccincola TaxID=1677857 RepID=A0A2K9E6K2_9FIRM|nr:cell division protein FtsL [Acetivibrio saccincola]AUG58018.1 Cell division protein FtsL [Acetivibrio saccincola]NLW28193.1 cell division protein FtsL [Acetivibrio saccincola]PQQ67909.1 cell division protein FtsL [Acetivibrio saccincola]HOA98249.1 cell division protein FtsL [Acetivibrio saccincola]HQD29370.1 cell division protein FtsL [Acetivibrio saccincola]
MLDNKQYIHGTAARKLEYDVYKENKVLKSKKKQRNNNKVKIKYVLVLLFISTLAGFVAYRYAKITELNYIINQQIVEYNEIREENKNIELDIKNSIDLNNIREVAKTKLGMQEPDRHQITYISIPRDDSTVVLDDENQNKENPGVLDTLVGKIKSVSSFIH